MAGIQRRATFREESRLCEQSAGCTDSRGPSPSRGIPRARQRWRESGMQRIGRVTVGCVKTHPLPSGRVFGASKGNQKPMEGEDFGQEAATQPPESERAHG